MTTELSALISTILRTSLSIDFVILVFLLSEFRIMQQDNISPVKRRPFKYGAFLILFTIVISVTGIFVHLLSTFLGLTVEPLMVLIILFQLIFIVAASMWLTYSILSG